MKVLPVLVVMLATVLAAFQSTPAQAAFILFTDRAAFEAQATNIGVDTFDDIVPGQRYCAHTLCGNVIRTDLDMRHAGVFKYDIGVGILYGGGSSANPWLSNPASSLNTGGNVSLYFTNYTLPSAAGADFFLTDQYLPAPSPPLAVLTVYDERGANFVTSFGISSAATFLGVISTDAHRIVELEYFVPMGTANVDNVVVGQAVPESASAYQIILGLVTMAGVRLRRRRVRRAR